MSKYSENNTVKYYDIIYKNWIGNKYTKSEIDFIKKFLPQKGKILDIGCGSGRHSIPLHKEGYAVTCIEPLKEFVKILNARAPEINVSQCLFKDYNSDNQFDVIISMWNAFHQLALTESEAIDVLGKMKGMLVSNGVIILSLSPGDRFNVDEYNFEHEEQENGLRYHLDWKAKRYEAKTKTVRSLETITVYDSHDKIVDKQQAIVTQRYWCEGELKEFAKQLSLKLDIFPPIDNGSDRYYVLSNIL